MTTEQDVPGLEELSYRDQKTREALVALTQPETNEMKEAVFRAKFLPFFKLEGIPKEDLDRLIASIPRALYSNRATEDTLRSIIMNQWMLEVKSPYLDTEVYDVEGKLVFVIPPIMVRQDSIITNPNLNVSDVVAMAINQDRVHPRLGDRVIDNYLTPFIGEPLKNIELIEMWNKVFDYYGTKQYDLTPPPVGEPEDDGVKGSVDENGYRVIDDEDEEDGF